MQLVILSYHWLIYQILYHWLIYHTIISLVDIIYYHIIGWCISFFTSAHDLVAADTKGASRNVNMVLYVSIFIAQYHQKCYLLFGIKNQPVMMCCLLAAEMFSLIFQFVTIETFTTSVFDEFPKIFCTRLRKICFTGACCVISYLIGLLLCTHVSNFQPDWSIYYVHM